MTAKTNTPQLSELLTARIQSIASKYGPQADDVIGHVTLKLCELMTDKQFAAQEPGFHIKRAKWEAQKFIHSQTIYNKYVEDEPQMTDKSGEAVGSFFEESAISKEASVESQVIANEFSHALALALEALPEQQRNVAKLVLAGYGNGEIAATLNISKGRVSQLVDAYQTRMRVALSEYA